MRLDKISFALKTTTTHFTSGWMKMGKEGGVGIQPKEMTAGLGRSWGEGKIQKGKESSWQLILII